METFNNTAIVAVPTSLNLKLNPPFFSRSYGVLLTFSAKPEDISIKYETQISYLKTIEDNKRLFKIDRISEVYINDLPPGRTADQLAYETGKVFYPLIVEVAFDGSYIGINNHQEIKQRWILVKQNVLSYFSGDEVNEYLSQTENTIYDEFALDICFQTDFFINTFFSPIYQNYGESRTLIRNSFLSLVAQMPPIEMEINTQLAAETNHYGAMEIEQNGKEIVNDENLSFNAIYSANFVLDIKTRSIESLLANYQWQDGEKHEVDIKVFRIDEGQIHQQQNIDGADNLIFLDPVYNEGKKGFFKNLFKK
ncbi:hypothetical protein [Pedobacter mendelii]|uniref:Uncharacterized protein n=1 Tax=Pedobacter mendelii TaxID=1908240 RepID=A0ABQ2BPJ8_9SPHI|nr:hypothetical protein [Pedobacter mendelii]GGI29474.1 hypothetical protein GCM10008119_37810 [Pedobacter mendelii]